MSAVMGRVPELVLGPVLEPVLEPEIEPEPVPERAPDQSLERAPGLWTVFVIRE
jgi:hypothetical protein